MAPVRAGGTTTRRRTRAQQHRAEAVAAARGEEADGAAASRARSRFSQSAVPKSRLADWSMSIHVSSSRSAIVSHVGRLHAGGDVPVDAADVVARLVRARLAELRSVPRNEAAVVALEQTVEPARDGQLEAAQTSSGRGTSLVDGEGEPADRFLHRSVRRSHRPDLATVRSAARAPSRARAPGCGRA